VVGRTAKADKSYRKSRKVRKRTDKREFISDREQRTDGHTASSADAR
jgi:hypothetical protein